MRPPPLDRQSALVLDVDGTLLEIALRPELVRVPAELPKLLDGLAQQRGGALALVSGRRIDEVDWLLRPWRGPAAGLHGAERRRADASDVPGGSPADRAAAAALDRSRPALRQFALHSPGVRLEDKGMALALHYREAPDREAAARDIAERWARQECDSLQLIAGKMIFELRPLHHSKGVAIAAFMAEPPFRGRRPVFLGDDTTDEDGFAEVNRRAGLSIRVGESGEPTAAGYRLPSVDATLAWLGAERAA